MRNCKFSLFILSWASLAWSQTASTPAAPAPGASASVSMKPQGPEAVASTEPNKVVATIDGKDITARQAMDFLKALTPEERKRQTNLSEVLQSLYTQQKLADQALKMNLDQQTPWKDRLVLAREQVLATAYVTHLREDAAKASTDDPKAYYDAHPDEFEQDKISGIFVRITPPGTPAPPAGGQAGRTEQQAEEKANEIEKKLKAGGDFAALARTDNDNSEVAAKAGDLGTIDLGDPKQQLPPALRAAIVKLQPGQVSEPIHIRDSFLIVKLESRKKADYATVQSSITEKLHNEKAQSVVKQEVLEKYKIKVDDPDFFEAPGARPVPTLQKPPAGAASK